MGASALSYRIEVAGRPYVLRLESFRRDEVRDPHRSYACMRAAAEAGIAPAVRHADAAAAVAIMDFVPHRPMSDYLRRAAGPGARPRQSCCAAAGDTGVPAGHRLSDSGRTAARPPARRPVGSRPACSIVIGEGFERIREAYPWDGEALVSSHNDLNPGEHPVRWRAAVARSTGRRPIATIPWSMWRRSRYSSPLHRELEQALLRSWLGREPDRTQRARLALMRLAGAPLLWLRCQPQCRQRDEDGGAGDRSQRR